MLLYPPMEQKPLFYLQVLMKEPYLALAMR
uniref:Uncharacterized protein n=1 Tax=Picea sitchensis TaxID=3332 RepID=A0A6B9XWP6_PICSI|nr:hypothetical protein Q903MT_gene4060 [Picea sitchensis]